MAGTDLETEAKFYVRDLARVEARLRELGAALVQPRLLETNLRFDGPAGELSRVGSVLRLRRDATTHLTFKGNSRLADGAVTRTEIEVTVLEYEAARRLLEDLGYHVFFAYEKRRATFEIEGVLVMLDELPYGSFVEIEGELDSLAPLAARLGLDWAAAIPAGYHALFERARRACGLGVQDLTFENFRGIEISSQDLGVLPAD